jgi:hypothetical protein
MKSSISGVADSCCEIGAALGYQMETSSGLSIGSGTVARSNPAALTWRTKSTNIAAVAIEASLMTASLGFAVSMLACHRPWLPFSAAEGPSQAVAGSRADGPRTLAK